jgi:hypothetical protein
MNKKLLSQGSGPLGFTGSPIEKLTDYGRAFFQKAAVFRSETVERMAVDIDLSHDPSVASDGNNDLRLGFD